MFALIPDKGALARYARYFGSTAAELITKESKCVHSLRLSTSHCIASMLSIYRKNNGHQTIDIVKDVINATSTQWVCETLVRSSSLIPAAVVNHSTTSVGYP